MAAAALVFWAALIAGVDWRSRRIPNLLLLAALVPAMFWLVVTAQGLLGVAWWPSLAGASALLVALPGYWAGQLGAGDVKLLGVMGFLLGWPLVLWLLLASALLLGGMALVVVSRWGRREAKAMRMPGGVALAGGFVATLVAVQEAWI